MAAIPLLLYGCAKPPVSLDTDLPRAPLVARPGRPGFVIAAPHSTADAQTASFAAELARRTGFALLVAAGPADEERVRDAAQGALVFYAEIRGTTRRESAQRIEMATVGVDAGLALRLRALYELIRDAHVRATPGAPRLDLRIEPADQILYAAAASTRGGVPRPPTRALRLELPPAARTDARERYLAILSEFLTEAATLPAGR